MALPTGSGGLRSALASLERILAQSSQPLAELDLLGDPQFLHSLLYLHLCTTVKRGPAASPAYSLAPSQILSVAQDAAIRGTVPLSTPYALRECLETLEANLRGAGAWRLDEPLWWHPLPARTEAERLWERWEGEASAPLALPPSDDISVAFGGALASPGYLSLPQLVEPALLRQLYHEAVEARRAGTLLMRRGKVGAAPSSSAYRWDLVQFLAGTERGVLRDAPSVAGLIQWILNRFAGDYVNVIGLGPLFPPQNAMLACYPAPCEGYSAHVDNPGGEEDNGRLLTLLVYLNPPERACNGGELALWVSGAAEGKPPNLVVPARGTTGILFDARAIAHEVQPVREGPDRWALTFWFNGRPSQPANLQSPPRLGLTDVLLPIPAPPVPRDTVLFHELDDDSVSGKITVHSVPATRPTVGLVSTVYRGGTDLDAWCAHHFSLGLDHAVLIFDHLEDPQEAADAARLASRYPASQLTTWSGGQLLREGWPSLPRDENTAPPRNLARRGSLSAAVSARQSLNASAVLRAAQDGALPIALDWLLHLDADELFYLQGAGRGGDSFHDHFAAAQASGLCVIRYLNHELLLPYGPESGARFKVNPRLAAALLGKTGWSLLADHLGASHSDRRPYFNGYTNGKAAVWVGAGLLAAGVHGWSLHESHLPARRTTVAGPSILHFHLATPATFRRKFLDIAETPQVTGEKLFNPLPTEVMVLDLIRSLKAEGAGLATVERRLDEVYRELTCFSENEVDLLEEGRLVIEPTPEHCLSVGPCPARGSDSRRML